MRPLQNSNPRSPLTPLPILAPTTAAEIYSISPQASSPMRACWSRTLLTLNAEWNSADVCRSSTGIARLQCNFNAREEGSPIPLVDLGSQHFPCGRCWRRSPRRYKGKAQKIQPSKSTIRSNHLALEPEPLWFQMLLRLTPVGLVETMWAWADRSIRRTCGSSADASPHRRPVSNTCPSADGLTVSCVRSARVSPHGSPPRATCVSADTVVGRLRQWLGLSCPAPRFLSRSGSGPPLWWRLIRLGSAPCRDSGSVGSRATRRPGTGGIDDATGGSMRSDAICLV